MQTSLSPIEQGAFYAAIRNLINTKSPIVAKNTDVLTEAIIDISISESLGFICDYIYRPDKYVLMNPTIHYILADMAIDLLLNRLKIEKPAVFAGDGAIDINKMSELKQGDTTIKMSTSSDGDSSSKVVKDVFKNYKARLNRYRRPI